MWASTCCGCCSATTRPVMRTCRPNGGPASWNHQARRFFALVTEDIEACTVLGPGGIDLAPEPLCERGHADPLIAA